MGAELLADLRQRLTQLPLLSYSNPACDGTLALNRTIRTFASDWRLRAVQEFSVEAFQRPDGRNGRIDWLLKC